MKTTLKILHGLTAALLLGASLLAGTSMAGAAGNGKGEWGKGWQYRGSETNPVLWADVPDPDVIRVGDDYYMVSTTMSLMPGGPVMHSRDLVNWETIGYIFDRIEDNGKYDLNGGTVYGRGQWATSLKYRDGRFYAFFSPNDEPHRSFIYTAKNPAGPWELLCRSEHFHDASLLLDDDGRVYLYSGGGDIRLRELSGDLSGVKEGGVDKIVIRPDSTETGLHEGSRAVKVNGKYYLFVISWPAGKARNQLCYRADHIEGPYEKCRVSEAPYGGFGTIGQGTIVDDPEGNWWAVIFQDRNAVGRTPMVLPVVWKEGWPMVGNADGTIVPEHPKRGDRPVSGGIVSSDEFDNGSMSINWEWNHNPVDGAWSLDERKGWLRLHTAGQAPDFYQARNTVSQRMFGPDCRAEVKLDLKGMKPGDTAGFGAMNGDSGLLSVVCGADGKRRLVYSWDSMRLAEPNHRVGSVDSKVIAEVPLKGNVIYLRIDGDFRPGQDWATFAYSTDGREWTVFPEKFKMQFDYRRVFMGTRYALYNYSATGNGGYVDVDWFRTGPVPSL